MIIFLLNKGSLPKSIIEMLVKLRSDGTVSTTLKCSVVTMALKCLWCWHVFEMFAMLVCF